MFTERFDALMNISEISNSTLARAVYMTPSHISRLRTGARSLPKKHDYLTPICLYLADHFKKDYQINALQKLTGIGTVTLETTEDIAQYLENWLLDIAQTDKTSNVRLTSGSSYGTASKNKTSKKALTKKNKLYSEYLYGNAGKRKAVEQFFLMILQEEKPQTIFLFSDENMSWLYEDPIFVSRWTELFTKVILEGNRVKIVHTVSRDMNEVVEAVAKWTPIYSTGMLDPYYYPRLRDGIFQRTIFIAPNTAAIISSSVQQNTEGMLNLFITDKAALNAILEEYKNYLTICRPLMRIFTERNTDDFRRTISCLFGTEGNACLSSSSLPLFAMPESLVKELAAENAAITGLWKEHLSAFQKSIKKHTLSLKLLNPELCINSPLTYRPALSEVLSQSDLFYSKEQYRKHLEHLIRMQKQYKNLKVEFRNDLKFNMMLFVKEEIGVVMAKTDAPKFAFVMNEPSMINAFWDYLSKHQYP